MKAYGGFTKKEIVTPKNNNSKVNGHVLTKMSGSKGDGLSVKCIWSRAECIQSFQEIFIAEKIAVK